MPLTALVEGVPPSLSAASVAGFAHLSLVGTGLAFVLWFNGIRRLPAIAPPLLGLASPITGAALGWVLLGQSLSASQLIGFAITIVSIAYGATLRDPSSLSGRSLSPDRKITASSLNGDGCGGC